jgi:putative phage-type endonuclease
MLNPQDNDSWLFKRIGKATASRIGDIVRTQKNGAPYKAREDYLMELVLERLTGRMADHFTTPAMERGKQMEAEAALAYAMETGHSLAFADFVDHPVIAMSGASPDRLVNDNGLLEVKCPMPKAHIEFLMTGIIPENYRWQQLWQCGCTNREWNDFMSYNPDFPAQLQSKVLRYHPEDAALVEAERAVALFLAEVDEKVKELEAIGRVAEEQAA